MQTDANETRGQCERCGKMLPINRMYGGGMCRACFVEEEIDTDYDGPMEPHDPCERCGGEAMMELRDCPELWGEDCFVEKNRLVMCPECGGKGF